MSDNFKSDYSKYADKIKPSKEFTSRLKNTLNEEAGKKKKPRIRYIRQFAAAAAACLIVAVGAALAVNLGSGSRTHVAEPATSGVGNYVGEINTGSLNPGKFENISWYDKNLAADSLPLALAEKMADSLDYLSYNNENKFIDAKNADSETLTEIKALLTGAKETEERVSGEKVYYMAVFADGTVAKFSVSGGIYLEISGDEKIYKKISN